MSLETTNEMARDSEVREGVQVGENTEDPEKVPALYIQDSWT